MRSSSRSRSLHRALSNSSASTAASGVSSSRRSRFHEGTLRADSNISSTSASTAASASSCISKRKRSARSRGSRRSNEEAQDLSGVHVEEGELTRTEPGSSAAQQLAQQHFWQHKSKYEGRLRAENKRKARLLKKDPLHFARRPTDTDGLGYGIEHVEAHVTENLETKRRQEEKLPDVLPRGLSGRSSQLVEGWLSFVGKEEAARKIQVAWRRSWRRRHGIPTPLPSDSSSSSDSEDEPPARMRFQRRSSTMNTRVLQPRRSMTTGDRARRGSLMGEVRRSPPKAGEDSSLLPGRKSVVFDESSLSRLKEPSKSTDIAKPPGLMRSVTQGRRSSMPGILRPSLSKSDGVAAAKRAQQQQEQQQQEGKQLQWQDSEERAAVPAQAWRLEARPQGGSGEDKPVSGGGVSLSLAVPDEGLPTAFSNTQAQLDSCCDAVSPPRFSDRQQALPVQATTSHHRHAATAATTAGMECGHTGSGEEGHAAGDSPPHVTDRDLLLAELAEQQGSSKGGLPPRTRSFHHVGDKGGQPWGYVLRAHPQPIQRPVSRLSVESNTATPLLPRGKSALSLLAVQGSKPPHPTSSPHHHPSHLPPQTRSHPQLHMSLSSPMGGATNTAFAPTPINTRASFDVSEPSSPCRPQPGRLTDFLPGPARESDESPQRRVSRAEHSPTTAHHHHHPTQQHHHPLPPTTAAVTARSGHTLTTTAPCSGHSSSSGTTTTTTAHEQPLSPSSPPATTPDSNPFHSANSSSPSSPPRGPYTQHTHHMQLCSHPDTQHTQPLHHALAHAHTHAHACSPSPEGSLLVAPVHRSHTRMLMQLRTGRARMGAWVSSQEHDAAHHVLPDHNHTLHQQHHPQQQHHHHHHPHPHQHQQEQLLETRHSLPALEGDSHDLPDELQRQQRRTSLGVTNAELHVRTPKPPAGAPPADQSFRGRMLEHKHLPKPRKQVPSPSSPSTSSEGKEPAALALGLQGKRFSSMAR